MIRSLIQWSFDQVHELVRVPVRESSKYVVKQALQDGLELDITIPSFQIQVRLPDSVK